MTIEKDIEMLEATGCDILFLPYANEIYPEGEKQKIYQQRDSVALIGYRLNPNSLPTLRALFWSQMKREKPNYDSAFYYLHKVYQLNSEDVDVNRIAGDFYLWVGLPELASRKFIPL